MSENDAVLIGKDEVAAFLRVSPRKVDEWRNRYPDMPVFCESKGSRLCADKETLARWQRSLFQRNQACQ
jgi:hypothetical protein